MGRAPNTAQGGNRLWTCLRNTRTIAQELKLLAIHLENDPQGSKEKWPKHLEHSKEGCEARMMPMGPVSRLETFIPFCRVLCTHHRVVTQILLFGAHTSHHCSAHHYEQCMDKDSGKVIAVGTNAAQEVPAGSPLTELKTPLTHRHVTISAGTWTQLLWAPHPQALQRKSWGNLPW